jgi:type I restriction enzyme S subunit
LVPRGWRVGKIGDFAKQHKGSINPLQNSETLYEHFSLPAFDSQHMPVLELGTEIKSNKTSVPPDAVLLSKLNPHIPRVWLPVNVGSHAVCSTEFLVFVPVGGASKEFIYCAFTTPKFKELLCQLVTGTSNSHQRVKPDSVSSMSAVLPPLAVLEIFANVVKPMFERIGHNLGKAQTLATLRDTLLPRLISGQLRLPDAGIAHDKVAAELGVPA